MQLPLTNQNQGDFEPATQVSSVLLLANQSEKDISHISHVKPVTAVASFWRASVSMFMSRRTIFMVEISWYKNSEKKVFDVFIRKNF